MLTPRELLGIIWHANLQIGSNGEQQVTSTRLIV